MTMRRYSWHSLLPTAVLIVWSFGAVACSKHASGLSGSPVVPADTSKPHTVSYDTSKPYQLVWDQEFDTGSMLDTSQWTYEVGNNNGWGNQEKEYYTDARPENARIENGHLVIEARKESYQGFSYTSARIITRGKEEWQYGKIEVRARLPKGRGTWPAIWMLGSEMPLQWPLDGEIDIMEEVGFDPDLIHGSAHTATYNWVKGTQITDTLRVPTAQDSFHVYTLEWTPDYLDYYVDSTRYLRFTNPHQTFNEWPFDHSCYLILNLAIGGGWGGQQGIDDSIFPQQMQVDYVRVYQRK